MASYRTDILAWVRRELGDNGPAFVWSDELLYGWLKEAVYQLSLDLPKRGYVSFYGVPGQREYPLSGYVSQGLNMQLGLLKVEAPRGRPILPGEVSYRQEDEEQTNTLLATDTTRRIYENCWELQEFAPDQPWLVFRYAPIAEGGPSDRLIGVWFNGFYAVPPDDTIAMEQHFTDDPMLVYLICGRALTWLAEQRGKRADPAANRQRTGTASYYEKLYKDGLLVRKKKTQARTVRLVENV